MTRAVVVVHWPGKDTVACDEHAAKLAAGAAAMGFVLTVTPISPDLYIECKNCRNERKQEAA
jgi:hypothetical protein